MKKMKKAFTLAEVLIALTVIGIVSALTIPTLVQKTNKQEYVSALQKAYSTLSQATNVIIAENGSPKAEDGGWASSYMAMHDMYKKYMSTLKECGQASGCFAKSYKCLNNASGCDKGGSLTADGWAKFVLADGASVLFRNYSTNCAVGDYGGNKDSCFWVHVDVNGTAKPNEWGRDLFGFAVKENGLYPFGCGNEETDCSKIGGGMGCTCKVIREGKMDY